LCFNAHSQAVDITTPDGDYAKQWTAVLDTFDATGATDRVVTAGERVTLAPRSLVVFRKSG
jgi:glycogen operon protein